MKRAPWGLGDGWEPGVCEDRTDDCHTLRRICRPPNDPRARRRGARPQTAPQGPAARRRAMVLAVVGVAGLAVAAAGYTVANRHAGAADAAGRGDGGAPNDAGGPPPGAAAAGANPTAGADGTVAMITGLGSRTRAAIPAATRQVLVASGKAKNSSDTVVTLWTRTGSGRWHPGAAWPAHNALRGWTAGHRAGDLHSPIGVFTLQRRGRIRRRPGHEAAVPPLRQIPGGRRRLRRRDRSTRPSTTSSRSTTTASPARHRWTARSRSARAAAAASGCTSTTAARPTAASASRPPTWSTSCTPCSPPTTR